MKPDTYFGATRWLPVRNTHTEKAPSFAAMEVTGAIIENKQVIYQVTRPTADSLINVLFADQFGVAPDGGQGLGTTEPCIALLDDGATPLEGERWGTKRDSWLLHKDFIGHTVMGGMQGTGDSLRAFVRESVSLQIVIIELTTPLNPGSSATAKILWVSGGSVVNSTMDNILVYDPPGMITGTPGDRGYAYYDHQAQRWHVLNLQC